jgi:two-component system chemotaxis response regulator CheB
MNQIRDIVVIGAAAGGVTALAKVAANWPTGLPAIVMIALITPDQPSEMVLQIIASYAPLAVAYGVQGEALQHGRIYLSPPGQHMSIGIGGRVLIDAGNAFDSHRPSVNRLFAAAAAVFGARVIGIVLSGNTKDGAQGMRDITSCGGIGIVQLPEDAVEPQMPRSALKGDHPNFSVRASEIAPLVRRLMADPEWPRRGALREGY